MNRRLVMLKMKQQHIVITAYVHFRPIANKQEWTLNRERIDRWTYDTFVFHARTHTHMTTSTDRRRTELVVSARHRRFELSRHFPKLSPAAETKKTRPNNDINDDATRTIRWRYWHIPVAHLTCCHAWIRTTTIVPIHSNHRRRLNATATAAIAYIGYNWYADLFRLSMTDNRRSRHWWNHWNWMNSYRAKSIDKCKQMIDSVRRWLDDDWSLDKMKKKWWCITERKERK